jgi:hypothetical protein
MVRNVARGSASRPGCPSVEVNVGSAAAGLFAGPTSRVDAGIKVATNATDEQGMTFRRLLSLVVPLALVAGLAACEDDPAATVDTAATTTAGPSAGATTDTATDPTAPDPTSPSAPPAPATDPPATAAAPSGGAADASTGLAVGPPVAAPEGTTLNQTIKGEASITIDGPFSMSLSGGLCSFVDTTLFIQAGDISGDFISLSFITRDMSIEAITDTSTISAEVLQWQAGADKTAASYPDEIDIIFDGAGISGSFGGAALIVGADIPPHAIEFGGRFSCLPSPFQIRGAQGLNLTEARCNSADSLISAGSPTGDSALFAFDPASLSAGERSTRGALSFRIGTVVYTSQWALAEIDPDGLGATFEALMVGPDGVEFLVEGGFSCL